MKNMTRERIPLKKRQKNKMKNETNEKRTRL